MSTSMLVKKIEEAAAAMQYEATIAAWPLSEVDAVDMRAYGLMDGKAVMEMARKTLGE